MRTNRHGPFMPLGHRHLRAVALRLFGWIGFEPGGGRTARFLHYQRKGLGRRVATSPKAAEFLIFLAFGRVGRESCRCKNPQFGVPRGIPQRSQMVGGFDNALTLDRSIPRGRPAGWPDLLVTRKEGVQQEFQGTSPCTPIICPAPPDSRAISGSPQPARVFPLWLPLNSARDARRSYCR